MEREQQLADSLLLQSHGSCGLCYVSGWFTERVPATGTGDIAEDKTLVAGVFASRPPATMRSKRRIEIAQLLSTGHPLPLLAPSVSVASPYDWQVRQTCIAHHDRPADPAGVDFGAGHVAKAGRNWIATGRRRAG
jgi:hypothetical protein